MNEEILRSYGITHIVNWSSTAKCNSFDGIEYLCFPGIRTYKDMKGKGYQLACGSLVIII